MLSNLPVKTGRFDDTFRNVIPLSYIISKILQLLLAQLDYSWLYSHVPPAVEEGLTVNI